MSRKRLADQMQMEVIGKGEGAAFLVGLGIGAIVLILSLWLVG